MVKTYLKYELRDTYGLISTSNAVLDCHGGARALVAVTGTLDSVSAWDLARSERVWQVRDAEDTKSEVLCVAQARTSAAAAAAVVATGHSDGTVRLWPRRVARSGVVVRHTYNDADAPDGDADADLGAVVTLAGHRGGVTALAFDAAGLLLASGARDTDVVVWDVARERGLFRLRGHTAPVTALAWLERARPAPRALLLSASRDGLVKVWDPARQQCVQTVVGHRAEVLSVAVDPLGAVAYTGAADGKLRVWAVLPDGAGANPAAEKNQEPNPERSAQSGEKGKGKDGKKENTAGASANEAGGADVAADAGVGAADAERVLELAGELVPPFGTRGDGLAGARRVSGVVASADGRVLACVVGDRVVAVYKVATDDELAKKRRRRRQRRNAAAKKQRSQQGEAATEVKEEKEEEKEEEEDSIEDRYQYQWPLRSAGGKVRSVDLADDGRMALLAMANNTLELYTLHVDDAGEGKGDDKNGDEEGGARHFELVRCIEQQGHRTDIRAAALTADDQTLVTVSNGCTKVWGVRSGRCLRTVECTYGLCAAVLPGGRHAAVGTKEGTLQLVDIASGVVLEEVPAHDGAVWGICARPGGAGLVTGGADKLVKFWSFGTRFVSSSLSDDDMEDDDEDEEDGDDGEMKDKKDKKRNKKNKNKKGGKVLTLVEGKATEMDDDVLCVRQSSDGRLLAVAQLDSIVKVFKVSDDGAGEELKFFLSLYGHKLPVLALDMSDDGRLLVSGSADKNVKIWGLDFGDCHRSLFAHNDSVTQVAFVPHTHYFFSVGKDGALKYWDADNFEQVQALAGQRGVGAPCWCVAVGGAGQLVVTAGHDRSVRVWERTHEQLFLDEEKERRLDEQFEAAIEEQEDFAARNDPDRPESQAADRKTLATVRSGEVLLEALDLAEEESAKLALYSANLAAAAAAKEKEKASSSTRPESREMAALRSAVGMEAMAAEEAEDASSMSSHPAPPPRNPLMLGLEPADYVLDRLARIPAAHLEQSLLLLPFHHVCAFLRYADDLVARGRRVELLAKCVFFLLRTHRAQLAASAAADVQPVVAALRAHIGAALTAQRDRVGFNLAALSFMKRELDAEAEARRYGADALALQLSQIQIAQRHKQTRGGRTRVRRVIRDIPII